MATPLDLSLLDAVGAIFPFLFVMVFTFGVLSKLNVFGEDRSGLYGFIAFLLGAMVFFSPVVRETINLMAPWFVLFFFFLIFVMIAFMIFGTSTEDIFKAMKTNTSIIYWIIAIAVIIWIGSMTSVISSRGGIGSTGSGEPSVDSEGNVINVADSNQQSAFWATITHPKVLGLVLILLIATFTVQRMSATM